MFDLSFLNYVGLKITVFGVADADTTRNGGAVNLTEETMRDGSAVEGVTL